MRKTVMKVINPKKLVIHDHVRVVAPSRSLGIISTDVRKTAHLRFLDLQLKLSFADHAEKLTNFVPSQLLNNFRCRWLSFFWTCL